MSRSIVIFFMTLTIALGVQFAYAQPGRGMGMDPEQQIEELISTLEVTTEQEAAFREAMAQVNELRMGSMGGGNRGMREGRRQGRDTPRTESDTPTSDNAARGMEMMSQRRAELEEKTLAILAQVLNSAQLDKYKEVEAAQMEQMMSRMRR